MNTNPQLSVIVLAAGKGTRMKSGKAKILHEVFFAPMVHHVLNAVTPLRPGQTIVIIGHQRDAVEAALSSFPVLTVTQEEQLGTGHAVAIAEHAIPEESDIVMVLCGDTPLIRSETLLEMYATHAAGKADLTVMTTLLDNPTNYGRMMTDEAGRIIGIVEEKDATEAQKAIREINAGIYCVRRSFLFSALAQVNTNNSQGEVYLTDIVAIAVNEGKKVERYVCPYAKDVLGVNSRIELAQAHSELQKRRNEAIMLQGVTIWSPESVSIDRSADIGRDSLIMNGVQVFGHTTVGEQCILGQGAILTDCTLGNNVEIGPYAVLQDCHIPAHTKVAPHSIKYI